MSDLKASHTINVRLYQIKSFLLVYGAVKTTINDQGVVSRIIVYVGQMLCQVLFMHILAFKDTQSRPIK